MLGCYLLLSIVTCYYVIFDLWKVLPHAVVLLVERPSYSWWNNVFLYICRLAHIFSTGLKHADISFSRKLTLLVIQKSGRHQEQLLLFQDLWRNHLPRALFISAESLSSKWVSGNGNLMLGKFGETGRSAYLGNL